MVFFLNLKSFDFDEKLDYLYSQQFRFNIQYILLIVISLTFSFAIFFFSLSSSPSSSSEEDSSATSSWYCLVSAASAPSSSEFFSSCSLSSSSLASSISSSEASSPSAKKMVLVGNFSLLTRTSVYKILADPTDITVLKMLIGH